MTAPAPNLNLAYDAWGWKVTGGAGTTTPLITTAEAKAWVRQWQDIDDAVIDRMVGMATSLCEDWAGRFFLTRTVELSLDGFPGTANFLGHDAAHHPNLRLPASAATDPIWLPRPMLQDVSSVKYDDADGAEQTLATDQYQVVGKSMPKVQGRVVLAVDGEWPETADKPEAVRISYTAGYGDAPASVPAHVVAAVYRVMADLYAFRENTVLGLTAVELPMAARKLLHRERIPLFA